MKYDPSPTRLRCHHEKQQTNNDKEAQHFPSIVIVADEREDPPDQTRPDQRWKNRAISTLYGDVRDSDLTSAENKKHNGIKKILARILTPKTLLLPPKVDLF